MMRDTRPAKLTVGKFALLSVLATAMLTLAGCETIDGIFGGGDEQKLPGKRVAVLVVEQKLKVDDTLANTNVVLPPATTNADWPQIGGSPTHNPGYGGQAQ